MVLPAEHQLLPAAARCRRRVLREAVAAHRKRRGVEPHLERVLPARRTEPADVLARHTGRGVLDAVAEEMGVAGPSLVSKSSSVTSTPVSWWVRTRPVRQFSSAWTVIRAGTHPGSP